MRNKELVIAFPLFGGVFETFVLLAIRRKEPWAGCFSGFGGNIEEGDNNPLYRQVLELYQEALIETQELFLKKKAEFKIDIKGKESKLLHIYTVDDFLGRGEETEEMHCPQWFATNKLPIRSMVDGDEFWVPRIIQGESLTGTIFRDENFNFLDIDIKSCGAY